MTTNNRAPMPAGADVDLNERSRRIRSRADLCEFIQLLGAQARQNPDAWTNPDLSSFLEALGAWTSDMEGYFKNRGETAPEQPTRATFAQMLLAARVYE